MLCGSAQKYGEDPIGSSESSFFGPSRPRIRAAAALAVSQARKIAILAAVNSPSPGKDWADMK
jgi:hypothetical protein